MSPLDSPLRVSYRRWLPIPEERLEAQRSEVPSGSLGQLRLHCVAAGSLLGGGELQAPRASQVDPETAWPAHDPHEDLLATRAANHHARSAEVNVDPPDRVHRATARAGALSGGHLHGEDLAQETSDRVSVHLRLSCFHRHPPVAPNLSVLIWSG